MKEFFHIRYFIITALMFLVIALFSFIPINCTFLDPISKAIGDFDFYDIVYSRIREEPKVDTNIVIVNIGNLSRDEIANQINIINSHSPKVIAVDAIFEVEKNVQTDSMLAAAFSKCSSLVLVNKLEGFKENAEVYEKSVTSIKLLNQFASNGFANLPNDDNVSFRTIRDFRPFAKLDGKEIPAFASKVVELFDKDAFDYLKGREREIEKINYKGNFNRFYFLDAGQVFSGGADLNLLKDKIVLMGFTGISLNQKTFEDIYFTPLNERYAGKAFPDMYGVVIHANIISMILSKDYVNIMPKWLSIFLALILSFISAFIIYNFKIKFKDWFSALSKIYILIITLLNLFMGVMVLHHFNYKIDLTFALAVVVLTNTIVEIYQSFISKFFPALEKKSN
jgi:CHASE2 domain-containing sensor protein